jgi:hypothetical protein
LQANGHPSFSDGNSSLALLDDGPETVPLGQWTSVTVVYHYDSIHTNFTSDFYINGILNSSANNSSTQNYPSAGYTDLQLGNLGINGSLASGDYKFNGSMHDVAIYNRALSATEVGSNYLNTEFVTNVSLPDLPYNKMTTGSASNTNLPLNIPDSSVQNNTNEFYLVSESTVWTNGVAGQPYAALHFDGGTAATNPPTGSYINTSNSSLFNFTNNTFTINIWLLPYQNSAYLMGNNKLTNNGWFLALGDVQIQFGVDISNAEIYVQTGSVSFWPGTTAFDRPYGMVTVTRNGTNAPLVYLNGLPIATELYGGSSFPNLISSSNPLTFGVGTNGAGILQYDGNMWLPQIWSTNLSSVDIANLYLQELQGVPWP